MSDGTVFLLKQWKDLAQNPSPDGFVFPSESLSTPLSADSVWRRNMKPLLEKIGMGWATFQILRKTNASLSKKEGIDPKVAADQRGPRDRSQPRGLYNIRYGAEKSSSEDARSRHASKTTTEAVSVRLSRKSSKRTTRNQWTFLSL
jgi:integrase